MNQYSQSSSCNMSQFQNVFNGSCMATESSNYLWVWWQQSSKQGHFFTEIGILHQACMRRNYLSSFLYDNSTWAVVAFLGLHAFVRGSMVLWPGWRALDQWPPCFALNSIWFQKLLRCDIINQKRIGDQLMSRQLDIAKRIKWVQASSLEMTWTRLILFAMSNCVYIILEMTVSLYKFQRYLAREHLSKAVHTRATRSERGKSNHRHDFIDPK